MDNREARNEWAESKEPKGIIMSGSLKPTRQGMDTYQRSHPKQDDLNLIKLECRKLCHPTCDLLKYYFTLEV
jgi:hypothetical protein